MKKTIVAATLLLATLVPAVAFAYPVTRNTIAVHSYRTSAGTRVNSYLRRGPGAASGGWGTTRWSDGRVVRVRQAVRNNANGTQRVVPAYVRGGARTFTTVTPSAASAR